MGNNGTSGENGPERTSLFTLPLLVVTSPHSHTSDWAPYVGFSLDRVRHLSPLTVTVDRDSGRFRVDPSETQRRRELFWELYTYDSWQVC